jgi:hypothetical protein
MKFNNFSRINIFTFFLLLLLNVSGAIAGEIKFQVTYHENGILIKNSGNEVIFNLNAYLIGNSLSWEAIVGKNNFQSMLAPGESIEFETITLREVHIFSKYQPVLITGRDQAGGNFSQLAWRNTPENSFELIKYKRDSNYLYLENPNNELIATFVINFPHDGLSELVFPLENNVAKPVLRFHEWTSETKFIQVKTGLSQGGAWIINMRRNSNQLFLQIIPDGRDRILLDNPIELNLIRNFGFILALIVSICGASIFLYSIFRFKLANILSRR